MSKPWLIVPVKPFAEGKSRLGDELPSIERAALSRRLLEHVLATAATDDFFAVRLIVSRDACLKSLAARYGARLLAEHGNTLNLALEQARRLALQEAASAILILPSDLPRLQSSDLTALLTAGAGAPAAVISPSRDGGTNALLLRPPYLLPFAFGPDSFTRHCELANQAGVPPTIIQTPTLAFDLDTPRDLAEMKKEHF